MLTGCFLFNHSPILSCGFLSGLLCLSSTQSPAPWSGEGKKMAKKLGLTMQYPEGYLEAQQANGRSSSGEEEEEKQVKKRGKKRKSTGGSWHCSVLN